MNLEITFITVHCYYYLFRRNSLFCFLFINIKLLKIGHQNHMALCHIWAEAKSNRYRFSIEHVNSTFEIIFYMNKIHSRKFDSKMKISSKFEPRINITLTMYPKNIVCECLCNVLCNVLMKSKVVREMSTSKNHLIFYLKEI